MTGNIQIDLAGPSITVHGLFEQPITLQYLTEGEAEDQLRRLAALIVSQLREKAIATRGA